MSFTTGKSFIEANKFSIFQTLPCLIFPPLRILKVVNKSGSLENDNKCMPKALKL